MADITVRQQKDILRRETAAWQRAAVGLFAVASALNIGLYARIINLERSRDADAKRYISQIENAEHTRDLAVRELGELSLRWAKEQQARADQARAYEAVGEYVYMGTFKITAYCPCEACCGRWADGLTATGVEAGPGIVAVDKSIIPLGSTVIIDGQRHLAADTGVMGYCVDICLPSHQEAEAFGVREMEVWVESDG